MSLLRDIWPVFRESDWRPSALARRLFGTEERDIRALCGMMMDSDGDYSSLVIAERILDTYERLDHAARLDFYTFLNLDFDLDPELVAERARDYADEPSPETLRALTRAAEPRRQELLRRLNLSAGGTRRLVQMRGQLLGAVREFPDLGRLDVDFQHLFSSWFNRGFLVLQPVDWTTPAHILEKIIAYEAVHEIRNWNELRRRLEPDDRHCYALFHPVMEDEPLVFVEVALTADMPAHIDDILDADRAPVVPEEATHAVFYSISNCHRGLDGVSFGNFLIKQVASNLRMRFPALRSFATISPVPGFRRWLEGRPAAEGGPPSPGEPVPPETLLPLAARYLLEAKLPDGKPLDPVARFHLKNGARLERLNADADPSPKGLEQSLGLMVNYVYDLARVEENHETYMKDRKVASSGQVRRLLST